MSEKANIQVNSSLMGEKLLKGIKYLEEAVRNCIIVETELPSEIKKEENKYKKAKLRLELGDIKLRREQLEGLLIDRKNHFEKDFLPKHEEQLKDCNANWDYYFNRIKEFASVKEHSMMAITLAFKEYMRINPNHEDEEQKIAFFQAIKQAFGKIDGDRTDKPKIIKMKNDAQKS